MNEANRAKLLEQQLTIFAEEFQQRMGFEDELRGQVEAVRSVLMQELYELRDVYLMHKRHLEESIETVAILREIGDQLDVHVTRGTIKLGASEGANWYHAFKLMTRHASKVLLRQKRELEPYLEEGWNPPSPETWAGQVEHAMESKPDSGRQGKAA